MSKKPLNDRRKFILNSARSVGIATIGGLMWGGFVNNAKSSSLLLRPPGALKEKDFLKTCIKCGLCVEACPYEILSLAKLGEDKPLGTPYFTPRDIPCYLCEDIPCTNACPTDSLDIKSLRDDKDKPDINASKMGLAVVNQETCIAYWGIQCDACYRACPLIDKAITVEYEQNKRTGKHAFLKPIVHKDSCTGCGMCEHACVTKEASIYVLPMSMIKGKAGEHYIRGWVDSDNAKIKDAQSRTTKTNLSSKSAIDSLNDDNWLNDE